MTSTRAADAPRPRARRSATESLLSIVLLLEAFVVFFATLVAFSLELLPVGVAFGAGAAFIVLIIVTARLVKSSAGQWFGWVVQALLLASGILIPLMFVAGGAFALLYLYCFLTGRRLDRRNAHIDSLAAPESPAEPEGVTP